MDLILCHTTADFDALGAAVGLTRLLPGARIVLAGGCHPGVRDFLALHRDEYGLIESRAVNPKQIRSLSVVDCQKRDRLGKTAEWLDLPNVEAIAVYDHHLDGELAIRATQIQIEAVGATTTLIVEHLQKLAAPHQQFLTSAEATVMALGIHVDTGSLLFENSTPRDALALAWLMAQGASLSAIATYVHPGLSPKLQKLLKVALETLQAKTISGYQVTWVWLPTHEFMPGLSSLASELLALTDSDVLLLANTHPVRESAAEPLKLNIIGRSRIKGVNLNQIFQPLGGGGHSSAASLSLRGVDPQAILDQILTAIVSQIPHPPTARELMSSPVRTIRPETTISEAQRILLRYGHSGLSVVNERDELVGIISRRDIDLALHHGFSHAPVKGYMSGNLKTITPETLLSEIERLMVTYDVGRLPVLEKGQLVGIVTRTDVLRQWHQTSQQKSPTMTDSSALILNLRDRLAPQLREFLQRAAAVAESQNWQLYLVGGAVRDLLLAKTDQPLMLSDLDLVVDGILNQPESQNSPIAESSFAVQIAQALQKIYPAARLDIHGQFQTAALLWHKDTVMGSLWVDIATARTEFYPYPAANPEVEASSIRQDLYRRDFTINALAIRLTAASLSGTDESGFLLDFFGGMLDLRSRQIRVLHANSFIEDPTRIYRAVRFAVRLQFTIEPQTESYIRYALNSGIYDRLLQTNSKAPALQTRLKSELKYILQAPYWQAALQLLAELGALRCLHPSLQLDRQLWWQMRLSDRCLRRFDSQQRLEHWQFRLEVLIAHLSPEHRGKVATNLQLSADSITRLQNLAEAVNHLSTALSISPPHSEVVKLLRRYELPNLILIIAQVPQLIRRQIWHYLTCLSQVQPLLNGNDLKKLGYQPGKQFKEILETILAATLDGKIGDRTTSEAFLLENFPRH